MAAHRSMIAEAERRERNLRGESDSLLEFFRGQAEKYAVNAHSRGLEASGITTVASCAFRDEYGNTCFDAALFRGNVCRRHYDRLRYEKRRDKMRARRGASAAAPRF
jgi:hypothetical protein